MAFSKMASLLSLPVDMTWENTRNLGDAISPHITKFLSKRPIRLVDYDRIDKCSYLVIGSILQKANYRNKVWGSGFISSRSRPKEEPHRIFAVRGPLSRDILQESHIKCPSVFGDPAVLTPLMYKPNAIKKKKMIGIIPHYVDKSDSRIRRLRKNENVTVINIEDPWDKIVRQILSVEFIFSSSLHGLILADSYGIPSLRFVASDKIIGGDFKFLDYRLGVGGPAFTSVSVEEIASSPMQLIGSTNIADISKSQERLIKSCPFIRSLHGFI